MPPNGAIILKADISIYSLVYIIAIFWHPIKLFAQQSYFANNNNVHKLLNNSVFSELAYIF